MNSAEQLIEIINNAISNSEGKVVLENGILTIFFEDGSYVDFTEPKAGKVVPEESKQ